MFEKMLNRLMGSSAPMLEKRQGLYVSRPVLNAAAWAKWAVAAGIPNPVPAEQLHVTIIASRTALQAIPDQTVMPIYISPCNAVFAGMGPEAKALALCWDDWALRDRFWTLQSLGAVSDWPSLKPHLTLSYDAAGYDIPLEAFTSMPPSLMLGPEVIADFAPAGDADEAEAPEEIETLLVIEIELAKSLFARVGDLDDLDIFEKMALRDAAAGKPLLKSEAADVRKAISSPEPGPTLPPTTVEFFTKADDCMQIVYGWGNLSTKDGVDVVDSQKDVVTIKAQHQYVHALLTKTNTVNVEHTKDGNGDYIVSGTVVEGLVMDKAMQDALETKCASCGHKGPVDLGKEGSILGMYVPDRGLYDKTGPGQEYPELSIGALPVIEE